MGKMAGEVGAKLVEGAPAAVRADVRVQSAYLGGHDATAGGATGGAGS